MQTFWIISIGLVVLASLFLLIPLWRGRKLLNDSDYQLSNTRLIKQRITELEEEVSQGVMTEKHKEQAIKELKPALVDETTRTDSVSGAQNSMLIWASFIVLVGLSVVLYLRINSVDKLAHVHDVHQRMDALTQKIIMGEGGDITLQDVRDFSLAIEPESILKMKMARGGCYWVDCTRVCKCLKKPIRHTINHYLSHPIIWIRERITPRH